MRNGHDPTARLEDEVAALRLEVERLQDLDRHKSTFLNAAVHELRTPLTSIRGYAEFLEDGLAGDLSTEQHSFVRQIVAGSERIRRLVDDMLDFARIENGTFRLAYQEADLCRVVSRAVRSLEPQCRAADLELIRLIPREPILMVIDPDRIGQVVLNLVANAIKFTEAGGGITVSIRSDSLGATVQVEDTGIGIPSRHLPRLFDKYYMVDPGSPIGTGLGLPISRGLVEAHGGRMGVSSVVGEGSRFWFTVPLRTQLSFLPD